MAQSVVTLTFRDNKGKTARTQFNVPDFNGSSDLLNLAEFVLEMQEIIDDITTAQIISCNLVVDFGLGTGLKTAPGSTSDVEEKAWFTFRSAENGKVRVQIPSAIDGDVMNGTDVINQSDTQIAAFIAAMTAGIELTDLSTIQPTDNRGSDITTLSDAYERFRRS